MSSHEVANRGSIHHKGKTVCSVVFPSWVISSQNNQGRHEQQTLQGKNYLYSLGALGNMMQHDATRKMNFLIPNLSWLHQGGTAGASPCPARAESRRIANANAAARHDLVATRLRGKLKRRDTAGGVDAGKAGLALLVVQSD